MTNQPAKIVGNPDIDNATERIALELYSAGYGEIEARREAGRLRDAIITGAQSLTVCYCCLDNACECEGLAVNR